MSNNKFARFKDKAAVAKSLEGGPNQKVDDAEIQKPTTAPAIDNITEPIQENTVSNPANKSASATETTSETSPVASINKRRGRPRKDEVAVKATDADMKVISLQLPVDLIKNINAERFRRVTENDDLVSVPSVQDIIREMLEKHFKARRK